MFRGFTAAERGTLVDGLKRVMANLSDLPEEVR
jgi:hypothetical protein